MEVGSRIESEMKVPFGLLPSPMNVSSVTVLRLVTGTSWDLSKSLITVVYGTFRSHFTGPFFGRETESFHVSSGDPLFRTGLY